MLGRYSRYHNTSSTIDSNGVAHFREWVPPKLDYTRSTIYTVTQREVDRLWIISYEAYGTPDLWWAIAYYNGISDAYSLKAGDKLKLPSLQDLMSSVKSNGKTTVTDNTKTELPLVKTIHPYRYPPLQRVGVQTTIEEGSVDVVLESIRDPFFLFSFPVPEGVSGIANFQLDISSAADFSDIVLSLDTRGSVDRWVYFDVIYNEGNGAHRLFPVGGIDAEIYQGQVVYYIFSSSQLTKNQGYYFRYKAWVDGVESAWFSPGLIIVG
jgi:hypothetical protein